MKRSYFIALLFTCSVCVQSSAFAHPLASQKLMLQRLDTAKNACAVRDSLEACDQGINCYWNNQCLLDEEKMFYDLMKVQLTTAAAILSGFILTVIILGQAN